MKITVEHIMGLETISESFTLVAGKEGTKNIITFVTTLAQSPDLYEWVPDGAFILSTLYNFKDHRDLIAPTFIGLIEQGISGIAIKTNRFLEKIPKELIDIANQYKIPLFEITRDTRFKEIIQAITSELNHYQTNLLIEVERHYQELTKVALISGDFDQFLKGLGRRRNCSILCFGVDYRPLGTYMISPGVNPISITEWIEEYITQNGQIIQYVFKDGLHVFPCIMKGNALGYLVLYDKEEINEKFMLMANQLVIFLTLKLVDQLETEQKMLAALLVDILFKHNLKEDELNERLALHGLKRKNMYRIIIVRERKEETIAIHSQVVRKYCNKICDLIGDVLVIFKTNEAVILAANELPDMVKPPRWLRLLGDEVFTDECPVFIGIGPAVSNAIDIQSSYHIAKRTTKSGIAFEKGGVLYYGDYLTQLVLLSSVDTPEQEYLISRIINPLKIQDNRYNTELLKTLDVLLFANDLMEAALVLHVHVNTIRYRVNKINELTGYDFFTVKGRYEITTAYLMHCYK